MPTTDAPAHTADTTLMQALTIVAAANQHRTALGVPGYEFSAALLLFAAFVAQSGTEDAFIASARLAWSEMQRQGALTPAPDPTADKAQLASLADRR